MNLIIVESPTKARTISKFLDSKYKIESSFGHIRDLPTSAMGVDLENFTPKYVIPAKAKKTVTNLKNLSAKADGVILATDEDREGEAIAWHLIEALKLNKDKIKRIAFHEITKDAILKALADPRTLDMRLVDAQQARRVLDRLVGYELSPFLWKKVAKGLSAGRVQSVAVRLIVEREREIETFKPEEYWNLAGIFAKQTGEKFEAILNKTKNKPFGKMEIKNKEQTDQILAALKDAEYSVARIEKKETSRKAPAPFATSTLQQTANRWLGFSARQTMTLAQKLYETGLITYMRTDSLNLSEQFLSDAQNYLKANLGERYSLSSARRFKTKSKSAQEAHEAIRPTDAGRTPEKTKLESGQAKLYKLIWQRAIASQMPDAIFDAAAIDIDAEKTGYQFRATGQTIKFDGFLKIYPEKSKELELPQVEEKEKLDLESLKPEQHFTKPPARYSDAGLVKIMEKYGIGRPSTYAPTIATIENRNYVERDENKKLKPTEIAFIVNDLLVKHFPAIVDYEFTAKMENELDEIAEGKKKWKPVIENFYDPFHENLEKKTLELKKSDIVPEEKTGEICDKCGAPMVIKRGRYGKFLACSAFPECKNIKNLPGKDRDRDGRTDDKQIEELKEKYSGEICDKCGAAMTVKVGRFGPFLGCANYPKCKNIKNIKENKSSTGIKCPVCGKGEIVAKRGRRGVFYGCDRYPECKTTFWGRPTGEKCPDCGALLVEGAKGKIKCSDKECGFEK